MFDRITFDPRILGGRASICAMPIPVSVIIGIFVTERAGTKCRPTTRDLPPEDIQQALSYAAWRAHEEVVTA